MTDQHSAVTFLLAAHAEAEKWATAASDPQGWWLIEPRFADHRTICEYVIQGERGPVVHVEVEEHDTEAHRAEALLIQANSPRAVLLRVAQERDILAEHAGTWTSGEPEYEHHHEVMVGPTGRTRYVEVEDDEPIPPYMCITCEAAGWPCRTVLGLAKAWGWEDCQTLGGASAS